MASTGCADMRAHIAVISASAARVTSQAAAADEVENIRTPKVSCWTQRRTASTTCMPYPTTTFDHKSGQATE
jgi:hypothetical protein